MSAESRVPQRAMLPHADMSQFSVRDGELLVGGIPLTRLAARAGQTPFYAYDRTLLRARVDELRAVLPPGVKLHYAMKANPMPALVGFMAGLVDGVDVASAGELKVALDAGADPMAISFAGPGKRDVELRQAVASGALTHIESIREVAPLRAASEEFGVPARVAVRVNPDFELKGAGMRMGGGAKPFGVDVEQVPALLRHIAASGLSFEGFHLFSGSQSLVAEAICEAQRRSYQLAVQLADHAPTAVQLVNLGGGFGVPYFRGEKRLSLAPIAENLAQIRDSAHRDLPGAQLAIELGRYLVAEAGVYVCRVIDRKVSRGQTFIVTDGGMHHHLAASGNFGQVIRRDYPVAVGNRMNESDKEMVVAVGPSCTPLDVLSAGQEMPAAEADDFLVVFQSGAYGLSASPAAFLSHPSCVELLV